MEKQQWEKPDWEAKSMFLSQVQQEKFGCSSEFSGGDSDTFPGAPGADLGWDEAEL